MVVNLPRCDDQIDQGLLGNSNVQLDQPKVLGPLEGEEVQKARAHLPCPPVLCQRACAGGRDRKVRLDAVPSEV